MNRSSLQSSLILLGALLGTCFAAHRVTANDVTDALVDLGIPYAERYPDPLQRYARNPWDLHAHGGMLYLSAGNSSNVGPAGNAGPVPILRFDPRTGKTQEVFGVDDEQIDLYFTLDDQLYLPGHDARESWALGNFYRLERDGGWAKHRTVPRGVHVYAMAWFDGKLFAGTGTVHEVDGQRRGRSAVCVSNDRGKTWTETHLGWRRIHAFLEVGDTLFAIDVLPDRHLRKSWAKHLGEPLVSVFEYRGDEGFVAREDLTIEQLFPGYPNRLAWRFNRGKPVKAVSFGGAAVYIGGAIANDHQYLPVGVFIADSLEQQNIRVRAADLPAEVMPWDLMLYEGRLYVLASHAADGPTTNVVYVSDDAVSWKELLRFDAPTFARSFDRLNHDWYFALGSRVSNPELWAPNDISSDTGRLLRIPAAAVPERPDGGQPGR